MKFFEWENESHFAAHFSSLFCAYPDVVARENVFYEQGPDFDPQAADSNDSELRLGGISHL